MEQEVFEFKGEKVKLVANDDLHDLCGGCDFEDSCSAGDKPQPCTLHTILKKVEKVLDLDSNAC